MIRLDDVRTHLLQRAWRQPHEALERAISALYAGARKGPVNRQAHGRLEQNVYFTRTEAEQLKVLRRAAAHLERQPWRPDSKALGHGWL